MSTPPLLIGAALLFWGHQTGLWPLAAPGALLLETGQLVRRRRNFSAGDFNRVSDACTLIFVAMAVYLYATRPATSAFMALSSWLPLAFLPLMAAQAYSVQGRVDVGALLMTVRGRIRPGAAAPDDSASEPRPPGGGTAPGAPSVPETADAGRWAVDVAYPYFVLCILSASAANLRTPVFYPGMFALASWALWRARPGRAPAFAWAALLALAGVLGRAGHAALHELQDTLERRAAELVFGTVGVRADPNRSDTAIGRIGELKQSGEILLRIEAPGGRHPPALLREASYNHYGLAKWFAMGSAFRPARGGAEPGSWELGPSQPPAPRRGPSPRRTAEDRVAISAYLGSESRILALPPGTFAVDRLPAEAVSRNQFGAVKAEGAPGFAAYEARFVPDVSTDAPPDAADLKIPRNEQAVVSRIAGELRLRPRRTSAPRPPREILAALGRFFQEKFTYSIYQGKRASGVDPLEDFLLRTRAGHCEFFATATVLLLREAGIPARYATGYSVQEFSRWENAYVVRQRHAHAWTLAYIDGAWVDFDTTPASWEDVEAGRAPAWQPLSDAWSWCACRISRRRWAAPGGRKGRRWPWLLLLVAALLPAWKWFSRLNFPPAPRDDRGPGAARPGLDSEIYRIEKKLEASGLGRHPWETQRQWAGRVSAATPGALGASATAAAENVPAAEPLRAIVALHYRLRFDPEGLDPDERRTLKALVDSWLTSQRKACRPKASS